MSLNYILLQAQNGSLNPVQSKSTSMDVAGFADMSNGIMLFLILTVVVVLFWLYHTYYVAPRLNQKPVRKKTSATSIASNDNLNNASEISDEVSAVIGLALHLYQQRLSDDENARLTIARVSRTYSPWSSKIYGLRQNPRR
jgi:glutaconyl-CoA/methylmalonyl-CoA decarboxylase subunit delta